MAKRVRKKVRAGRTKIKGLEIESPDQGISPEKGEQLQKDLDKMAIDRRKAQDGLRDLHLP